MDARVHNYVVTPRIGAPVEINMLWYNALKIYKLLSQDLNFDSNIDVSNNINLIEKNFKKYFWNSSGYLNDYIDQNGQANEDFRCNQIYAVSLPFSLLTKKQQKQVVEAVDEKLYTGYGLRTLDQANKEFKRIYKGDQWSRDTAYHQGTVWPFFIAPFLEAYLKVNGYTKKSKQEVIKRLQTLQEHFYSKDCIHGISEIFDGDQPNDGRGCINQAWSVAGIIKLYFDHHLDTV